MGKWNRNNELQEYLDDLKERQDHQYSKGYWVGKVRKSYSNNENGRTGRPILILNGIVLIVGAVVVLLPGLFKSKLFDWDISGSFTVSGIMLLLGLLYILAGVRKAQRKKKEI